MRDAIDPERALHTLVVERIAPPSSAETAAAAAEEMLNAEISRLREEAAAAKASAKTASDNLAARLQALYGTPAAASGDEGAAAESSYNELQFEGIRRRQLHHSDPPAAY